MPKINQKTIKDKIELSGIGLHNGLEVNLNIKPSSQNSGIIFKRTDIKKNNIIHANFKNVVEPILCTKLKNENEVSISTVEHLMAAFYGEDIDNVLVEVDAPEIPIMDGSAVDFVDAIRAVGIEEQSEPRKFIKVLKKVEVQDGQKYISIEPLAKDLIIDFELIYKNPLIRTRRKEFKLSNGNLAAIYNNKCDLMGIKRIYERPNSENVYHIYPIVVKNRNLLLKKLKEKNIEAQIHYEIPIHLQKVYKKFKNLNLKVTNHISKKIISLPFYPGITKNQIKYLFDVINKNKKLI